MFRKFAKFVDPSFLFTNKSLLKSTSKNISYKCDAKIIESTFKEIQRSYHFRPQKNLNDDPVPGTSERMDEHFYRATDMKTRKYQQTWKEVEELYSPPIKESSYTLEEPEVYSPKSCREILDEVEVPMNDMNQERYRLVRPQRAMELNGLMYKRTMQNSV